MAKGKSKLNTKFVVSGLAVAALGLGGAFALYKKNSVQHPERYIAAGDDAARQHDYIGAAANYEAAVASQPMNADLHLKLGKAYFQLRTLSGQNFGRSIAELTRAEELNPESKEAWEALLSANEYYVTQRENSPGSARDQAQLPMSITLARGAAEHLVKLDPNNLDAKIATSSLMIRGWLLKLPIPLTPAEQRLPVEQQKTDDQKVEGAIADLSKLLPQHPENDSIPYWIARAKINQATNILDASPNSADASPLFAEAAGEFDSSIGLQPKNISLYLKKAEILDLLQRTDPSATTVAEYRRQMRQTLDSAQSLADISSPDEYQLAKVEWARYLRKPDPARSEEVFRDLITRFANLPQYQIKALQYRMELADLLRQDVSRQADALALLDAIPSVPPATLIGYDQQQAWAYSVSYAKLTRAQIETDQLERHPLGKKSDDLIADITSSLAAAESHLDGTVPFLRARGRFELAGGHLRAAIQTLTQAADKSTEQFGNVPYDLLRDEANAYMRGQQTPRAIELLEKAMKDPQVANNGEIHGTLANLHLQNRDFVGAKPYVDWLAVRLPDDPAVISLQIQSLGPDPDPVQAKALYDRLPEKTPAELTTKLRIADGLLKSPSETIRLLKLQHQADPTDVITLQNLIKVNLSQGHKDAARVALEDLKTAHPTEPSIAVWASVIDGDTPEAVWKEQLDLVNKIPDSGVRERRLADLYGGHGQPDEQLKHLQAALSSSPNDINLLQSVFMLHLGAQRFAEAEAMLPHLSELDADSAKGLMLKAKLCLAKKDTSTAVLVGRQLTRDFPEFSGSWELYGEALSASGQTEDACQQFITALDKQATNVDATRGLISCSVQLGKLGDARQYITKARQQFPDDPVYREMEVNFEILYGNPEAIVPSLAQTLKDHPDVRKNYPIMAQALLASSRACAGRGEKDGANKYLARTRELYEQAVARWPDDLSFAAALANVCLQSGDLTAAEAPLIAISERPHWKNQPAPLVIQARIYLQAQKLDLAEPLLRKALGYDANGIEARTLLADCLVGEQKYEEALRTLKPACDNFAVREKYVNLLLALSRGSEAEDVVVAALKNDPKNPGLIDLLIDVYQSEHKADQAMKLANEAIANDPSNIGAYYLRGALEASGVNADFEVAKKDLSYYCDSMPTDARGRILLAEVLDHTQDSEGAIKQLQIAMKYANLERQPRLMLLREYLLSTPVRTADANQLLTETLAIPQFQHDTQFEMQAAILWARSGDGERALAAVRDVMSHVDDKSLFVNDYLSILLQTKNYSLLLDESKDYVNNPKTTWLVFSDRAQAKAMSGDKAGAVDEFQTALDRAGTEKGTAPARNVAQAIVSQLGTDKALQLILPRAKNSATWTFVSVGLYEAQKNLPAALAAAESAMAEFDTFEPPDQSSLLEATSGLYIRSEPPQTEKAMAIYRKMVERDPGNITAMNNIASLLCDMTKPPRPKEALVWSTKAYDLCRQNNRVVPAVYDTQGWVLILCGQLDDGIQVLHAAIDKADFPDAHYHLAKGYLLENHPEAAKRELQNAVEMLNAPKQTFTVIDSDLRAKVDAALKEADQKIQATAAAPPPM